MLIVYIGKYLPEVDKPFSKSSMTRTMITVSYVMKMRLLHPIFNSQEMLKVTKQTI